MEVYLMDKKNIIIFYKQGKSIHYEKNTLYRWLKQSNLLMPESTNIMYITKYVDIHFVDIEYRNINKFLKRYPNFDFGIDVNTDELYSLYPDRIPNDLYISAHWSKSIINYIQNNSNTIHVYYINKDYTEIQEMDINELEYIHNKSRYFKSKESLINSVYSTKSYYEDQIQYYQNRLEKKKNMLSKIDNFLKLYSN